MRDSRQGNNDIIDYEGNEGNENRNDYINEIENNNNDRDEENPDSIVNVSVIELQPEHDIYVTSVSARNETLVIKNKHEDSMFSVSPIGNLH